MNSNQIISIRIGELAKIQDGKKQLKIRFQKDSYLLEVNKI